MGAIAATLGLFLGIDFRIPELSLEFSDICEFYIAEGFVEGEGC